MSVIKACKELIQQMTRAAGKKLKIAGEDLEFNGVCFFSNTPEGKNTIEVADLARQLAVGDGACLSAVASHSSPVSPPPFMAGFAQIELDLETGHLFVIDYVGVVDCGTPINPNLARIQTEGGIVQGIGMALFEDIGYGKNGKMMNASFMQYKIPSRLDIGDIRVEFKNSYEPTGPFGAKSIGEVVINTPAPAIANAIANACGVRLRKLPMTAEDVLMGIYEN